MADLKDTTDTTDTRDPEDYSTRKSFQRLVEQLCTQALESSHAAKHAAGLLDNFTKTPIIMAHNESRTCYDGNSARPSGHAEFVACWRGRYLQARQRPRSLPMRQHNLRQGNCLGPLERILRGPQDSVCQSVC